jgi:thiosulfate reductase cytochrome b subunit
MYLYPIWVRIWHLLSAILILLLILTGVLMQFTGADSKFLIALFPGSLKLHDICAVILTVSYMAFVIGNIISGNGKYYRIRKSDLSIDFGKQLKYYFLGIFRKEKNPFHVTSENKFNPVQKVMYFLIMYLAMPLLVLSGIIMFLPDTSIIRIFGTGMYIFTDTLHIVLGFLVAMFLIIHIYMCTTGPKPGSYFRAIISGYQESEE